MNCAENQIKLLKILAKCFVFHRNFFHFKCAEKLVFIIIIDELFSISKTMDSGEVIFAKVTDVIGKTGM